MLFIVIHQASELWLKLAGHELAAAIRFLENEQFGPAFKVISRVKQIFLQLTQSWNILSTLTPVDYLKFRDDLGQSSGFQSFQYRQIEFLLGNRNPAMLMPHAHRSADHAVRQGTAKQTQHQDLFSTNTIREASPKWTRDASTKTVNGNN